MRAQDFPGHLQLTIGRKNGSEIRNIPACAIHFLKVGLCTVQNRYASKTVLTILTL